MTPSTPLLVVGGGPAGLGAAIEAARAGLPCTLIDEARHLGGQIYRTPSDGFRVTDATALGKDFTNGERLRAEVAEVADRVEVLAGTSALGVWDGREVLWASEHESGLIRAARLVLAAGAYDRPVPFPGWTLPGVMTAGGVQALMKTTLVRPGRRALVAGTGPLLAGVANRLRLAGVEVAAVLEAGPPWWPPEPLPAAWDGWEFMADALDNWKALVAAGVPVLPHHTVLAARGGRQVEGVAFGPVRPEDWTPLHGGGRSAEVDLVVVGFGFVPNTELTTLAGCRHRHAPDLGGWVPDRGPHFETSVPGVFAAGDGAGVVGAEAAELQGRVAGITAAEQAGALPADEARRRREAPLVRLGVLAEAWRELDARHRVRPGLADLATPETVVCRCEEVTRADVRAAIDEGAKDLQAVKLFTRLGMGPCQGRQCAPPAGTYLCRVTGRTPSDVGRINPRPPVKPVTLGALAKAEGIGHAPATDPLDAVGGGAS
ncbi:MAG: NAD(P)/FAD-dependent oxidoreductase [Gemmataceae bacterium]|nr:NAD(P)/FAD-dependent oxidoreductase [Gemmataceae bacterium]